MFFFLTQAESWGHFYLNRWGHLSTSSSLRAANEVSSYLRLSSVKTKPREGTKTPSLPNRDDDGEGFAKRQIQSSSSISEDGNVFSILSFDVHGPQRMFSRGSCDRGFKSNISTNGWMVAHVDHLVTFNEMPSFHFIDRKRVSFSCFCSSLKETHFLAGWNTGGYFQTVNRSNPSDLAGYQFIAAGWTNNNVLMCSLS